MVSSNNLFSTALLVSIVTLNVLFFGLPAKCQVGLLAGIANFKASEWLDAVDKRTNKNLHDLSGLQLGADYWFRLKEKRVEFTVEGNYTNLSESALASNNQVEIAEYGLQLNTSIYPLDFGSDCYCPTWSKNGDVFAKGFFLQLIVGAVYQNKRLKTPDFTSHHKDLAYKIGAGLGLDIGLSDFFTLTPLIRLEYFPGLHWEGLATENVGDDDTNASRLFAGLRLGFRFDELNKYY